MPSPYRSRGASDIRDALWGDRVSRARTILALLLLMACVAYLLVVHGAGMETEVIRDRYWKNAVPLFEGDVPVTEYPPLALVFIAVPYLFGSTPWGYETAYVGMAYIMTVIGLALVGRIASRSGRDPVMPMVVYSALIVLMLEFVLDRFDVIAMVFTLGAAAMFAERRTVPAFVLLAMGVLTKVYPVVLFPVFVLCLLMDRRFRDAAVGTGVFVATGVAAVAVCWLIDPGTVTNFIDYNSGRPLQIESVAASLLYPFGMLGITPMWIEGSSAESFWSDNLRGAVPDAVSELLLPLLVVLTVAVWAFYAYARRGAGSDFDLRLMTLACLACLLVFMATNKVFSSQYLIWAIGPAAILTMYADGGFSARFTKVLALALVLTQANFAYNIGYLGGGAAIDDLGMMIILARNVVVVAALWLVAREMLAVARPGDAARPETSRFPTVK